MELCVDGRTVHAYSGARPFDAAQPSIVFVHGAAHDHSVWALQSRYFAWHGCNVLAVDLPGHGRSAGEPLPTIEALADWLVSLLDAAALPAATLVGHSMGALAVLDCAARHPSRATRIALLGPAVPMVVSDALRDAAQEDTQLAYEMINAWSFSARGSLGANPSPGMSMTGNAMRLMQRARPGALRIDLGACHVYAGGLAAAARCRAPALLLLGGRDLMAPIKATPPLVDALRERRVVTLPDAGHALMAEAPGAVLDALVSFVVQGQPHER